MTTWGAKSTIGAIAVAAAIAGVGGAAISAATGGRYHGAAPGLHGPGGPPASAPHVSDVARDQLHGEYVVTEGGGRFETRVSQTGQLTAIDVSSVTARSDDGFTQTYVIRAAEGAAPPPFSVGQRVTITGTREGEAVMVDSMRPPLA